jgi:hypothetical protein
VVDRGSEVRPPIVPVPYCSVEGRRAAFGASTTVPVLPVAVSGLRTSAYSAAAHDHQGPGDGDEHGGDGHANEFSAGIEWEDDMVEINRMTTPATVSWKLVDRTADTGREAPENHSIDWRFTVGDRVKIRLVNATSPSTMRAG